MDISIIFNLNNMKKTTITILLTIFLFASSYAQNNENNNGCKYELVKGNTNVSSDGTYLIAGYYSEKSGGGSLYLMSSDNLNNGKIEGELFTTVTKDEPPTTITLDDKAYSNSISGLDYRIFYKSTDKNGRKFVILNNGLYLTNSSNSIEFRDINKNGSSWILQDIPDKTYKRIRFFNGNKYPCSMIAFQRSGTSNMFKICSQTTSNGVVINLYKKVSHAITIGKTRYSTFYYSSNDAVLPKELTAYTYGIKTDENVTKLVSTHQFNAGDTIPAECAVVVKGNPGTYSITLQAKKSTKKYDNILKGTYFTKELEANRDTQYYMLSLDAKGKNVGFYWGATDGRPFTNKAHKAYLAIPKSASSKISSFILDPEDDSATGIETVEDNGTATSAIYDLSGRRTLNPSHGIYIMNGKKILK